MRLDRLITLGLVQPIHRVVSGSGRGPLPILMYHSISEGAEDAVSPYYRTATRPQVFAMHMALLRAEGYRVVGLQDGLKELSAETNHAGKTVILTFDDGLRNFAANAFPVLQEYRLGATVFLPTAFIGNEPRLFKGSECLTWSEVRELHKAGIEFGSHTVNHPQLYDLDFAQIRVELENSKAVMEAELGESIGSFAYPYAFPSADHSFVERFVELLKNAGYACAVTTKIGRVRSNDRPFLLKRLPINSADDGALFLAKLGGAYDWMTLPQDSFKRWKGFIPGGRNARKCRTRTGMEAAENE
jgi:peptidoglycan/xylan/chitin deacetylase (PgdA/CDA1 family)